MPECIGPAIWIRFPLRCSRIGVRQRNVRGPIQPHVPGSRTEALPDWAEKLGNRPVVYFSLGTVPIFNQPSMFEPVLRALADLEVEAMLTDASYAAAAARLKSDIEGMPSPATVAGELFEVPL